MALEYLYTLICVHLCIWVIAISHILERKNCKDLDFFTHTLTHTLSVTALSFQGHCISRTYPRNTEFEIGIHPGRHARPVQGTYTAHTHTHTSTMNPSQSMYWHVSGTWEEPGEPGGTWTQGEHGKKLSQWGTNITASPWTLNG